MSAIKDINLAPSGAHKIDWVREKLSAAFAVWKMIFSKKRPFEGIRIAFPFIWRQRPHICARYWQQAVRKCISQEVTCFPRRMMWRQHWWLTV